MHEEPVQNSTPAAAAMPEPVTDLTVAPQAPPPARLEDVDILAMENLDLKIRNQQLTLRDLDNQRAVAVTALGELARALEMKRVELTKKYGRPVRRDTVTPDGVFIVANPKS
jgi:hypothetical protein